MGSSNQNGRNGCEMESWGQSVYAQCHVQADGQGTTRFGDGKQFEMTFCNEMSCNLAVVSMQMNGTLDVRDVFKEAMGESRGKHFVRGTTSTDAHRFFQHISKMHYKKNKTMVKYAFKKCGGQEAWSVLNLEKQLSRKGKYVFFGATRTTGDSHKKQLKTVTKATAEDKVAIWDKSGTVRMDHAIGVTVDDHWQGKIYDNGCKPTGEKVLSIQHLADRMRSLNECYVMELYVCK